MQVVIAGATGFIGRELARQALIRGDQVFALVREQSGAPFDEEARKEGRLEVLPFGADADVLMRGFGLEEGARVVNAAGIVRERPGLDLEPAHLGVAQYLVQLAEELAAERLVHLSPLLRGDDPWTRSKAAAEQAIQASRRPWSILRSAPAFGPGDSLLDEVGAWMMRSPLIPRFLEEVPLDPVDVGDLALALLRAEDGVEELGGGRLTWGALLEACAEAAGKRLLGPRLSGETALRWARWLGGRTYGADLVPFTEDGFRRHQRGYTVEPNALPRLLGREPRGLKDYLATEWPFRA
ncbi:MAG TPA: NAD(P)H-binding protein [Holophagaceae bacterium]|nr:NAD(P)H-binding protein [Holophagaceae bacterium]